MTQKLFMVTVYVPQTSQNGRFRTLGIIAPDGAVASNTAAVAMQQELRNPALVNLIQIVAVTEMADRTIASDISGNTYVVSIILAPAGGNINIA